MKMGIVLAGGGGKGAYEIGVWKALNAVGLDKNIKHVSGTSVGGLNAALFIQGDYEKAKDIWSTISHKKILTRLSEGKKDPDEKGLYFFRRDGLKKIIDDNIDWSYFNSVDKTCYLACRNYHEDSGNEYSKSIGKVCNEYVYGKITYYNICGDMSIEKKKKILLATSAIPIVFPKEEIDGHKYSDGGFGIFDRDNTPVRPLYEIDNCDVILVIHLSKNQRFFIDKNEFKKARILELIPGEELGGVFKGVLNFSSERAIDNINLGYAETIFLFERIKGVFDIEDYTAAYVKACDERLRIYNLIIRGQEIGLSTEDVLSGGFDVTKCT